MKIVLCCAGGFSTTMLMDSMKKTVKDSAKLNIDDFQFTAIPVDLLQSEVEGMDGLSSDRRLHTKSTTSSRSSIRTIFLMLS